MTTMSHRLYYLIFYLKKGQNEKDYSYHYLAQEVSNHCVWDIVKYIELVFFKNTAHSCLIIIYLNYIPQFKY